MILKSPDPILKAKCVPVKLKQVKDLKKQLAQAYKDYQEEHPAMRVVGMAAPQIGRPLRAFYASGEIFVNPTIIDKSIYKIPMIEGCCSLPDDRIAQVERYKWVKLRWFDENMRLRTWEFTDSFAAVVQHEVDHLNGILINDHAKMRPLPKKELTNED